MPPRLRILRIDDLTGRSAILEHAISERKLVERAKGLLMKQRGFDEEEAYSALRKLAMERNQRLLIRPALSVIVRLAVGCAMRTVEPFGAHGAPYGIMNNSCRINSA